MRSMIFTHGRQGVLWLEVDRHGRVIVQSEGLSKVARDGLLEDALFDLAGQTRMPVRILRSCMIQRSTPWPRRLLAGILSKLVAGRRELAPSYPRHGRGEPPPSSFATHAQTRAGARSPTLGDSGPCFFSGYAKKRGNR